MKHRCSKILGAARAAGIAESAFKKNLWVFAGVALLCGWLGADTKPNPPNPPPEPEPSAKRMMTVDFEKTTLYPASVRYSLKAKALTEALQNLNTKSATMEELDALLDDLSDELSTLESEALSN